MSTMNFRKPVLGYKAYRVLKGIARVIHGAGIAAIAAIGVIAFTRIPGADGYIAVLYFVGAVACLAASGYFVWCIGGGER